MYRIVVALSAGAGVLLAGLPALAAASPWVGRLEAEQLAGWNSNVELRPGSPSDMLFRTRVGGTGRYVFPTKTMILGQTNYNLIRFAQLGQYNASMFLGNVMVMQPCGTSPPSTAASWASSPTVTRRPASGASTRT
jgi:hypothetical protein